MKTGGGSGQVVFGAEAIKKVESSLVSATAVSPAQLPTNKQLMFEISIQHLAAVSDFFRRRRRSQGGKRAFVASLSIALVIGY